MKNFIKDLKFPLACGAIIGTLGASAIIAWMFRSIDPTSSSTVGLDYLFAPIYFGIYFIFYTSFGFALGFILQRIIWGPRSVDLKILVAIVFSVGFASYEIHYFTEGIRLSRIVPKIVQMNSKEELMDVYENSKLNRNKFVLAAIADNPASSSELLDKIAHLEDSELEENLVSLFPIFGNNKKGLAVKRLIVFNPRVSFSTIEYLARSSQNNYVLGSIASRSQVSGDTLRMLVDKNNYLVDWGLASNKNTPIDVMEKLVSREHQITTPVTMQKLISNPSVPDYLKKKARARLLRR